MADGTGTKDTAARVERKKTRSATSAKLLPGPNITPKELTFVHAWLEGDTMAEAYRKAYPGTEASNDTLTHEGRKITRRPRVRAYLDKWYADLHRNARTTVEELIGDALRVLRRDPRKLFDEKGDLLPFRDWDEDNAMALHSITWGQWGPTVKFESRGTARDQLAKMIGAYAKDNAQRGGQEGDEKPVTTMTDAELTAEIKKRSAMVGLRVVPFTRPPAGKERKAT